MALLRCSAAVIPFVAHCRCRRKSCSRLRFSFTYADWDLTPPPPRNAEPKRLFAQVWRDAARYDSERARVLTWLLTICRSRALDFLRRRELTEPLPDDDDLAEPHSAPANDPQDLLISTQNHRELHTALALLAPLQRQLLALAFFRGLTHEEIAQHCRLPLGSVKTHIRKALAMLRATLTGNNKEVRT